MEQKAQIKLVRFHAGVFGLFFAFTFGLKYTIYFKSIADSERKLIP